MGMLFLIRLKLRSEIYMRQVMHPKMKRLVFFVLIFSGASVFLLLGASWLSRVTYADYEADPKILGAVWPGIFQSIGSPGSMRLVRSKWVSREWPLWRLRGFPHDLLQCVSFDVEISANEMALMSEKFSKFQSEAVPLEWPKHRGVGWWSTADPLLRMCAQVNDNIPTSVSRDQALGFLEYFQDTQYGQVSLYFVPVLVPHSDRTARVVLVGIGNRPWLEELGH